MGEETWFSFSGDDTARVSPNVNVERGKKLVVGPVADVRKVSGKATLIFPKGLFIASISENSVCVSTPSGGERTWMGIDRLDRLGAKISYQVDAHPHGLLPEGKGSFVKLNDGSVLFRTGKVWLRIVDDRGKQTSEGEAQALLDEHGASQIVEN